MDWLREAIQRCMFGIYNILMSSPPPWLDIDEFILENVHMFVNNLGVKRGMLTHGLG